MKGATPNELVVVAGASFFVAGVSFATLWPEWVAAVASLIVAGAAVFVLVELREVRRDRHVQFFLEMSRRWEGEAMTEAFEKELDYTIARESRRCFSESGRRFQGQREGTNEGEERNGRPSSGSHLLRGRGMIARAGTLQAELMADNFSGVVQDERKRWRAVVKLMQETDPLAFIEFERMAIEAKEADEAAGVAPRAKAQEDEKAGDGQAEKPASGGS